MDDAPAAEPEASPWLLYVLRSPSLGLTYVGITNDLERRLSQHNGDLPGGARATRRGRPWSIAATHGPIATMTEAMALEREVKRRRGEDRVRAVAELGA